MISVDAKCEQQVLLLQVKIDQEVRDMKSFPVYQDNKKCTTGFIQGTDVSNIRNNVKHVTKYI